MPRSGLHLTCKAGKTAAARFQKPLFPALISDSLTAGARQSLEHQRMATNERVDTLWCLSKAYMGAWILYPKVTVKLEV